MFAFGQARRSQSKQRSNPSLLVTGRCRAAFATHRVDAWLSFHYAAMRQIGFTMALSFDMTAIASDLKFSPKDADGNYSIMPIPHCLIWSTMILGFNEITEKNLGEWCFRLNFEQRIHGEKAYMKRSSAMWQTKDTMFTPNDLRPYIGLSTNASPMSRAKYVSNAMKCIVNEQARLHNAMMKEVKVEEMTEQQFIDSLACNK